VNYATEFSRSWVVIGRIVMRLNAPDFVGVESLGSCFLLPVDYKTLMDKHDDVVGDLEQLRNEHKGKDGVWIGQPRRLTA